MPTMQLRPWRHEKGMHLQNARSSDIGLIEQCSTRFRIQPVHYCADFAEVVLGDMICDIGVDCQIEMIEDTTIVVQNVAE